MKTEDVIKYLERGQIGYYGMDVYEKERGVFFFDHTGKNLHDPFLTRLLNLENVLVTPHQAFATGEALTSIATTTFTNINGWAENSNSGNELTVVKSFKLPLPVNTIDQEIHLLVSGYKYYFHSTLASWQD